MSTLFIKFLFFYQVIALQKMTFISLKKLFWNFFRCFLYFLDSKGHQIIALQKLLKMVFISLKKLFWLFSLVFRAFQILKDKRKWSNWCHELQSWYEAKLKNSWPRLSQKFPFGLKDFSTEIYFIKLQRLSIPNMDCSENIWKIVISEANFTSFLQISYSSLNVKALEFPKL